METSADGGDQRNSAHRIPTERSAIGVNEPLDHHRAPHLKHGSFGEVIRVQRTLERLEIAQLFVGRRLSQQGLRVRRAPLQHEGTSSLRKLPIGEPKRTRREIQVEVDAQLGEPSAERDGRALVVRREPLARVAPSHMPPEPAALAVDPATAAAARR